MCCARRKPLRTIRFSVTCRRRTGWQRRRPRYLPPGGFETMRVQVHAAMGESGDRRRRSAEGSWPARWAGLSNGTTAWCASVHPDPFPGCLHGGRIEAELDVANIAGGGTAGICDLVFGILFRTAWFPIRSAYQFSFPDAVAREYNQRRPFCRTPKPNQSLIVSPKGNLIPFFRSCQRLTDSGSSRANGVRHGYSCGYRTSRLPRRYAKEQPIRHGKWPCLILTWPTSVGTLPAPVQAHALPFAPVASTPAPILYTIMATQRLPCDSKQGLTRRLYTK